MMVISLFRCMKVVCSGDFTKPVDALTESLELVKVESEGILDATLDRHTFLDK